MYLPMLCVYLNAVTKENIVSCIGLFCKRDLWFLRSLLIIATPYQSSYLPTYVMCDLIGMCVPECRRQGGALAQCQSYSESSQWLRDLCALHSTLTYSREGGRKGGREGGSGWERTEEKAEEGFVRERHFRIEEECGKRCNHLASSLPIHRVCVSNRNINICMYIYICIYIYM